MRARLLAASVALSVLPAIVHAASQRTVSCFDNEGNPSICPVDSLKKWEREHYDYHAQERTDHVEWHKVHDLLGVTEENLKAHREYHEMKKRVHNNFHEKMKIEQRETAKKHQARRQTATGERTARPDADPARMAEGQKRCARYTIEQEHRVCMKPYLRPAATPRIK